MTRFLIVAMAVLLLGVLNVTPVLALTHHSNETEIWGEQTLLPLSNPVPTAAPSFSNPLPIAAESIDGKWAGSWWTNAGDRTGSIEHSFEVRMDWGFVVSIGRDGTYRTPTTLRIQGTTLIVRWYGGRRVETYQLFRSDARLVLVGTFTWEGTPWGGMKLTRKSK